MDDIARIRKIISLITCQLGECKDPTPFLVRIGVLKGEVSNNECLMNEGLIQDIYLCTITKEERVCIIQKAIDIMSDTSTLTGLCYALRKAIIEESTCPIYIPPYRLFQRFRKEKLCSYTHTYGGYWWPLRDRDVRIRALRLMEEYYTDNNDPAPTLDIDLLESILTEKALWKITHILSPTPRYSGY